MITDTTLVLTKEYHMLRSSLLMVSSVGGFPVVPSVVVEGAMVVVLLVVVVGGTVTGGTGGTGGTVPLVPVTKQYTLKYSSLLPLVFNKKDQLYY